MTRRVCSFALLFLVGTVSYARAADDIVLYSSDVTTVRGNWSVTANSSAAGGQQMSSVDNGWSSTSAALTAPNDYFEATFTATAHTNYHVWLRLRATGDSKWNDSVYVQFNDATDVNGSAVYGIGSTNALLVNLENCGLR